MNATRRIYADSNLPFESFLKNPYGASTFGFNVRGDQVASI